MKLISAAIITGLFLVAPELYAHHSGAVFFDGDSRVEISGVVTDAAWRNPHSSFTLTVTNESGQEEEWIVESNAVNQLERLGVSPDTLSLGDTVSFWGPPARRASNQMRAYNLLVADQFEVILWPRNPPERRWPDRELVISVPEIETRNIEEYIAQADGIFRTWSRGFVRNLNDPLPLTESAAASKEAYDPTKDPVLNCIPTAMPAVMDVSMPIEFSQQGDDIILRLESWDTVRTIHMGGDISAAAEFPSSREGYSVGHWEGDTLVVETTNIQAQSFDDRGTPMSNAVHVMERWTVNEDETGLHWQATINDPNTFTEPVVQEQVFPWVPGEEIKPYQCATDSQ